jgi:hypothetical protein
MAVRGIRQIQDWVLLRQSRQYLDQILLFAYNGIDLDKLADGQPDLDWQRTEKLIRNAFSDCLPSGLISRLTVTDISYRHQMILPDPDHWMGDGQPRFLPIVSIDAVFKDCQGRAIPLNHAIELLLD